MKDDVSGLNKLGSNKTVYEYEGPSSKILETFTNQFPERKYKINFVFEEFTSLCPKTGQPDFAVIQIEYTPKDFCIETKSLKMYFFAYRQHGSFMETIVNQIFNDCCEVCLPVWMKVTGKFNARGGIKNIVIVES